MTSRSRVPNVRNPFTNFQNELIIFPYFIRDIYIYKRRAMSAIGLDDLKESHSCILCYLVFFYQFPFVKSDALPIFRVRRKTEIENFSYFLVGCDFYSTDFKKKMLFLKKTP
jgi:hypothetical protein